MLYAQPKNFWRFDFPVVLFDLRTWNVERELEFNFNKAKNIIVLLVHKFFNTRENINKRKKYVFQTLPHHNRLSFVETWESKLHLSSDIHDRSTFYILIVDCDERLYYIHHPKEIFSVTFWVSNIIRKIMIYQTLSHILHLFLYSLSQKCCNCDKIKRSRNVSKSRTLVLMQPYSIE